MIYGGLGALIFSGYIIYDTDNLIKRFTYDQYVWAAVSLYLDVINLFLSLLTLLRAADIRSSPLNPCRKPTPLVLATFVNLLFFCHSPSLSLFACLLSPSFPPSLPPLDPNNRIIGEMKDWRGWDVEAGGAAAAGGASLYPNMMESPQLRWAFIRKVYTIVALQIVITIGVAAAINLIAPVRDFLLDRSTASFVAGVAIMILPFLGTYAKFQDRMDSFSSPIPCSMTVFDCASSNCSLEMETVMLPMMYFSERHPINFVLLLLFTVCIGFAVGLACTTRGGAAILEAATLTAAVVGGLTLYTFWAAKRGHDFSFLGPFLFAALLALTIFSLIQVLFPMGTVTTRVFGCISAVVFAGFIIYDTDNLIKRHSYDQYVCAAISLYLDIINLFLALLSTMED
ncbi:hypothetical protein BHM03_00032524 [Ensete ventricosum]|nr:hypothetical protein BHM03_00032524 [Ensete ventricosum]